MGTRSSSSRRLRAAAAVVTGALLLCCCSAVHHDGDFIHSARRAQFLKMRTHWHDLIEHHCPKFGQTRLVAIPINNPGPTDKEVADYRLQFSFDGDRVLTPWLTVIGRSVDGMPLIDMQLRRAGDELRGVHAKVLPLPDELLLAHSALWDDYKNASHWPKHVLVHYSWASEGDVDFNGGMYALMGLAMSVFLLLSVNTLAGVQSKVGQLLRDVVGSEGDALIGGRLSDSGGSGFQSTGPFIPFKGGSHVE